MPVKYWSFAGLMLTDWCNASCASCYLSCAPDGRAEMSVEFALELWRQLIEASPHGCRVHLTGGEPFGRWKRLIELCRRARDEGLGPLEKIETNAFWATNERIARERIGALDAAGMQKLSISADPYHQQFVPLERCRLAARVSEELLGRARVQVRWRDWLAEGFDTDALPAERRESVFALYAAAGRDRLNGRAVKALGRHLPVKPLSELDDSPCREALLRSRHVHVDPTGRVMAGTCAGIVFGTAGSERIAQIWARLTADHGDRPIVAPLAARGPVGLLAAARAEGFCPRETYAGKCQLCWDIRRHWARRGQFQDALAPATAYEIGDDGRGDSDGKCEG